MRRLVLVVLLAACSAGTGAPPPPTITTGAFSWKIERERSSFTAKGTAPVQVSDATHAYLLVYRVYWDKRLDPKAAPDTTTATVYVVPDVPASQEVSIWEYESRCRDYVRSDCLSRAVDPVARVELVGWTRFERP